MTLPRIEPITPRDLAAYARCYGVDLPEWACRPVGYAAFKEDGAVVGVGCVFQDQSGRHWALVDTPCLHGCAVALHRRATRLLASFRSAGIYPSVLRDDVLSTSDRWLSRLGFAPSGETINGKEVWR